MSVYGIRRPYKGHYGVEDSASLISRITDNIMPKLNEWQSRLLSEIYPVVFFNGIYYKVRKDGKIINKCVYSVLGMKKRYFGYMDK